MERFLGGAETEGIPSRWGRVTNWMSHLAGSKRNHLGEPRRGGWGNVPRAGSRALTAN